MRHMTAHSDNAKHEETNILLLNIMFLVALLAMYLLTPVYGVGFTATAVLSSFIASGVFIHLT